MLLAVGIRYGHLNKGGTVNLQLSVLHLRAKYLIFQKAMTPLKRERGGEKLSVRAEE